MAEVDTSQTSAITAKWLDRADWLSTLVRAKLRVWRTPLVGLGTVLFVGGAYWSFRDLAITVRDIRLEPLAMLACLVLPSLAYGGVGLALLARSGGLRIPLGRAMIISTYAYLAEVLPVPGGAIVRAGALVRAGGSLQRSTALVLLTAMLWVAMAMVGAAFALLPHSAALALPLGLIGSICTLGITAWLWSTAGMAIALQTLAHRMAGLALAGLRLKMAFAVLGLSIGFFESMPFVLALLVGSASSIAPAGLGISESLAALAATTGAIPPSVAFLAVALDRLLCLVGNALLAMSGQLPRVLRRIAKRTSEPALGKRIP